jgi:hypothetical protein
MEQEDEVARTSPERPTEDRARLHDDYVRKLHSAIGSDRPDLAAELSAGYAREAGLATVPAEGAPSSAVVARTKDLLRRLDRYTLQAYNPVWPYGPREVGVRS